MEELNHINLSFKCPKAFNELQPCQGGWYCNGCHKLVHDFRGKPEQEIIDIFAAYNYKLCGLFEADRIRVNPALPKWRKWAAAAVLTLGFTGLHQALMAQQLSKADSISLTEKSETKNKQLADEQNEIFGTVETSAEFIGGMEKFYKFMSDNLKFEPGTPPGKGFFTFIVEADGSLTEIKVLRSPFSKAMNEQIINMFKKSPRWRPGTMRGKVVRQQYAMPVSSVAR